MDKSKPTGPPSEKEHTLPDTFIEKREELYARKSDIGKARIIRDTNMMKAAVIEYMTILEYICNRIKPKLRGRYKAEVTDIQQYMASALIDVGAQGTIPDEVIKELDRCHEIVTEAMVSNGFDQITPTVLNM